jgi:hypothetical protein
MSFNELQRCDAVDDLLRHAVLNHPLPWTVERDWTFEVTAKDGTIIAKCMTHERAATIIAMAEQVRDDLDKAAEECEKDLKATLI